MFSSLNKESLDTSFGLSEVDEGQTDIDDVSECWSIYVIDVTKSWSTCVVSLVHLLWSC